jgi:AraC-like DNA-binding protein
VHEHVVHRVSPVLAPYVREVAGYRHEGSPPGVHVGMPSTSLTLVMAFGAPVVVSVGTAAATTHAYPTVVAGLHTAPVHIHHDGGEHGLHIALTPWGCRALLGLPAGELAEQSVRLEEVLGPRATALHDELESSDDWQERFAAVERVLLAALAAPRRPSSVAPEVGQAWRRIVGTGGRARVDSVAREVGWSTRHLQSQFRGELGLTPKTVARLARFERSVVAARDVRRSLAGVAAECGYADQAHLAREWRELAGLPPSRWRAEDALAFVQDEAPTGGAPLSA